MDKWVDITITGRDKEKSETLILEDSELSRQVFTLSDHPPERWAEIFSAVLIAQPGRLFRDGEVKGRTILIWGGPNVFDQRDADHLKKLVSFTNTKYREALVPADYSGLDAFDQGG